MKRNKLSYKYSINIQLQLYTMAYEFMGGDILQHEVMK